MKITLTTPVKETLTCTTVEIQGHTINHNTKTILVNYQQEFKEGTVVKKTLEFNLVLNNQPNASPPVTDYDDVMKSTKNISQLIKALYQKILDKTEIEGTIG